VNEDKSKLLYIGAGYSYRKPENKSYKVSARPEAHLGNKYVSTGTIEGVSEIDMFNIEAALVLGSFSLQGEHAQSNVTTKGATPDSYTFNSYYAEASYFLTGKNRKYKNSMVRFDSE